jgi:hypothetical protein
MIVEVLSRSTLVITIEQNLTFATRPITTWDGDDKVMRHQIFKVVKIRWTNAVKPEAAWDVEWKILEIYCASLPLVSN